MGVFAGTLDGMEVEVGAVRAVVHHFALCFLVPGQYTLLGAAVIQSQTFHEPLCYSGPTLCNACCWYLLMHPVECAISSEHHCNLHSRLYKLSDCLIVHSYSVTFGLPVPCQLCAFINELLEVLCFPIKHSKMPFFNCELDLKSVGL